MYKLRLLETIGQFLVDAVVAVHEVKEKKNCRAYFGEALIVVDDVTLELSRAIDQLNAWRICKSQMTYLCGMMKMFIFF
jgi:hypothetical protein